MHSNFPAATGGPPKPPCTHRWAPHPVLWDRPTHVRPCPRVPHIPSPLAPLSAPGVPPVPTPGVLQYQPQVSPLLAQSQVSPGASAAPGVPPVPVPGVPGTGPRCAPVPAPGEPRWEVSPGTSPAPSVPGTSPRCLRYQPPVCPRCQPSPGRAGGCGGAPLPWRGARLRSHGCRVALAEGSAGSRPYFRL